MTSAVREIEVISNTSPLYYLHQIGGLDILHNLYGMVFYPEAVRMELEAGALKGLNTPPLERLGWLIERPIGSKTLIPALVDLGSGEAEVIALGLERPNSLLILDDQLARRMADLHQFSYTGTLGILIKAKQRELIPEVMPLLNELKAQGMWISPPTEKLIRRLAEEE